MTPHPGDAAMLQRLGSALVAEWARLPMPLQRAIYERAVSGDDDGLLKHEVARFLHDRQGAPPA